MQKRPESVLAHALIELRCHALWQKHWSAPKLSKLVLKRVLLVL
jgi:hypothetical protein